MFFPVEKESPLQKDIKNNILELYGWDDGAHSFLRRGKEKVSAETALSFLAYPLRCAINPLDADVLIASFNKRSRKNVICFPISMLICACTSSFSCLRFSVFRCVDNHVGRLS